MSHESLEHARMKKGGWRSCCASALVLSLAWSCGFDLAAPSLDGSYRPQVVVIPDFRIHGGSLMYETGKEEVILSVTRGLFEEIEADRIVIDEYFLVQTDSSPFMLLTHETRFNDVPIFGGENTWVRNTRWGTAVVEEEDADAWKLWLEQHGKGAAREPSSHPPRSRFWKTSGPERDLTAEHHGLVELPLESGRRVWVKKP